MSVSKVILLGHVGQDPKIEEITAGKVAKFSLATSNWGKDKGTTWHNVTAWKGLAEVVEKYVKKGSQIFVEGRLESRKYTNKEGVEVTTWEVTASEIQLLGGKSEQTAKPVAEQQTKEAAASGDSDLPF